MNDIKAEDLKSLMEQFEKTVNKATKELIKSFASKEEFKEAFIACKNEGGREMFNRFVRITNDHFPKYKATMALLLTFS